MSTRHDTRGPAIHLPAPACHCQHAEREKADTETESDPQTSRVSRTTAALSICLRLKGVCRPSFSRHSSVFGNPYVCLFLALLNPSLRLGVGFAELSRSVDIPWKEMWGSVTDLRCTVT